MIALIDYGMGNLRSVEKGLEKVGAKEIVIVDDFSTDGTRELLQKLDDNGTTRVIYHSKNQGKGGYKR